MQTFPRHLELKSPRDTEAVAAYIAPLLRAGDLICLFGQLGSGKTFFAAALGRELGVSEFVDSPSFVLLKEYRDGRLPLFHLDLYRLKHPSELRDLGLFDFLESGITLIEWPELALQVLPESAAALELHFSYDGLIRCVDIVARGYWSAYFV